MGDRLSLHRDGRQSGRAEEIVDAGHDKHHGEEAEVLPIKQPRHDHNVAKAKRQVCDLTANFRQSALNSLLFRSSNEHLWTKVSRCHRVLEAASARETPAGPIALSTSYSPVAHPGRAPLHSAPKSSRFTVVRLPATPKQSTDAGDSKKGRSTPAGRAPFSNHALPWAARGPPQLIPLREADRQFNGHCLREPHVWRISSCDRNPHALTWESLL